MTLPARVFQKLRPGTLLHLDVMGIAHLEAERARYRLWPIKARFFKYSLKKALDWSALVTTINNAHAEYLRRGLHRYAVVVRDVLDEEWYRQLTSLQPPLPGKTVQILFVGSISRGRLDSFLAAARQIAAETPSVRIVVVGAGADLERYRNDSGGYLMDFVGYEAGDRLLHRYESADICFSDVWSTIGFPYKILEYMASGKAVLTLDTPSVREVLQDGLDSILCAESVESIHTGLSRLVRDAPLRTRLGARARERAEELQSAARAGIFGSLYQTAWPNP